MALVIDKSDAMTMAAIFLFVVGLARRYHLRWETVLPWCLGALVLGVRWYIQQQTAGGYYDRVLREYVTVQNTLELRLAYLYREPDWVSMLHQGLQSFSEHGIPYFRPFAQKLENIARILYFSETAIGFQEIEWSVARMDAGEALNHLLGLQYRTDVHTPPWRILYGLVAYFRTSFMTKIPGFQPEKVLPVLSDPSAYEAREWYPSMS